MNIKDLTLNFLINKEKELRNSLDEIDLIKSSGKNSISSRKWKSMNYKRNNLIQRSYSANYIISHVKKIVFSIDYNGVKNCLSPYGTFSDRNIFYYNWDILGKYSDSHKLQIILCEIFNSLQDYFINHTIDDNLGIKYRGRSLSCLYYINAINEHINLYNYNEQIILEKFNNKHPNNTIITFQPNSDAARYLMDQLVFNNKSDLGLIVEKWELHDSLLLKISPIHLHITECNGIDLMLTPQYNYKNIFYIKEDNKYIRSNFNNSTIRESKKIVGITKKLIDE